MSHDPYFFLKKGQKNIFDPSEPMIWKGGDRRLGSFLVYLSGFAGFGGIDNHTTGNPPIREGENECRVGDLNLKKDLLLSFYSKTYYLKKRKCSVIKMPL